MKTILLFLLSKILRLLAHLTLRRYDPKIIGVTGNVGKTSTKEAIRAVLRPSKRVRAGSKNFNNELGLPLVILGNWNSTEGFLFWVRVIISAIFQLIIKNPLYPEFLILEYGIDRPGDMTKLLSIARPTIAVVTALGEIPVHVEFFSSIEAIAREKEKLVMHLPATGCAILNADDSNVFTMKDKTRGQVVTYGFFRDTDVRATNFEESKEGESFVMNFKLNYGGGFVPVKIPKVVSIGQAYAFLAASSVGVVLGMNLVEIAEALSHYKAPKGRLNMLPGLRGSTIIDDTYNAAPLAMKEALETLGRLKAKRKIAVLGDMLELGKYTLEAHEAVGKIAEKSSDILITVGLRAKSIAEAALKAGLAKRNVFAYESVHEASEALQSMVKEGDLILIKASQGVRLEQVTAGVLARSEEAKNLLVRQEQAWKKKPGLYD